MRIRRFNENRQVGKERLDEIVKDLSEFLSLLDAKQKQILSISQEIGDMGLDDAITALQLANGSLSTASSKIDDSVAAIKKHDPYEFVPENKKTR